MMTREEIAKIIDHTNLKANATAEDIKRTCQEARKWGFRGVCINPRWARIAKTELEGTGIKVSTVIDWPCGASPFSIRHAQSEKAKKDGADELDLVMDIGNFKAGKYDEVLFDLKEISNILPTKVIIETGYLTDKEIKKASQLVKQAGAICVKTSTGMPPKVDIATKVNHVKLMRQTVGPDFLIKAAGGIRTPEDVKKMVEAGANIIGTSGSLGIMKKTFK